jgi:kynureninase
MTDPMINPRDVALHYERFRVSDPARLLLTGHSHQAWPDVALDAVQRAWLDAAEHVDDKWSLAFAQSQAVRAGYARLLSESLCDADYSLAPSTHDLLVRWLSALPYRARPRLVTTSAEFHTIRRQLTRLQEEGVEVVVVPAYPAADVGARLAAATDDRAAAVLTSAVFFDSAQIAGGLDVAAAACARHGAALLVDVYHALNVMPFPVAALGLQGAFVIGGGYKYCQLGEGCCFLRAPKGCGLRPVFTGWFADFGALSAPDAHAQVGYALGGARFEGATYDPTSHYRAAAVFDFFTGHDLTPARLRALYQHQLRHMADAFDALDADPDLIRRDVSTPISALGGFLTVHTPRAADLHAALKVAGVLTDYRGPRLRLGPAPYLTDDQLAEAIRRLGVVASTLR